MNLPRLVVIDSGALTRLAESTQVITALRSKRAAIVVPATVLAESLTGDHRRDVRTNRVLRLCDVVPIDESCGRLAAQLRYQTTGHQASAVDATVIAIATGWPGSTVLTTDPGDLRPLAAAADPPVRVESV